MILPVKIFLSKALSVLGKLLKTAGIAAIPLDNLPFTEAHSKGLTPDVGAMNLAEIYTNLPGTIWEAGEWVASKVQGKEHEWKPFYEATFGREYETKKLQETPLPVLEKRIDRWATDMAPAEEFDKISSYLDRSRNSWYYKMRICSYNNMKQIFFRKRVRKAF